MNGRSPLLLRHALTVGLVGILAACSGGGGGGTPASTGTTGGSTGGTGGGGTGSGGAPVGGTFGSTYFADDTLTLTGQGTSDTQAITVGSITQFVFRLATDYATQTAIIEPNQLSAFTGGQAFSGFGVFSGSDGYKTVTLAAGNYYIGVRTTGAATNAIRYELDRVQTLSNGVLQDYYKPTTATLLSGQRRWDPFTIQSGIRYWIDGVNSGLDVYVIDASELPNFQAGGSFLHYSDYGGANSPDLYGGIELRLNPGSYYLVQRNPSTTPKSINYVMERWVGTATATLASSLAPTSLVPEELQRVDALRTTNATKVCNMEFTGSGCGLEHDVVPAIGLACQSEAQSVPLRVSVTGSPGALAMLVIGLDADSPAPLDLGRACLLYPTPHAQLLETVSINGECIVSVPDLLGTGSSRDPLFMQWILGSGANSSTGGVSVSDAVCIRF